MQNTKGRPRSDGEITTIYESELYKLLVEKLPMEFRFQDGRINIASLAQKMGRARFTIYRWFNGENMNPKSAQMLVKISSEAKCERKGAITIEMLSKFVLGV